MILRIFRKLFRWISKNTIFCFKNKQRNRSKIHAHCHHLYHGGAVSLQLPFLSHSWDIGYAITKWQASSNSRTYCALLDQYEEDDDFLSIAALYEQNSLYGVDAYEQYRYVFTAASHYASVYGYLTELLEKEPWEDAHKNSLKYLCQSLDSYYEFLEREPYDFYYDTGAYEKRHLDAVNRMTHKIEGLLRLVFSFTEEEMDDFRTYSSAQKQVFIERRFAENE